MSRPKVASSFASRTAFDVLAVDSGESDEEEIVEEVPEAQHLETEAENSVESTSPPADSPPKLTKSAQRKAARLARKQTKKDKNGPVIESSQNLEPQITENNVLSNGVHPPSGSKANPVEVLEPAPEERGSDAATNGHVSHPTPDLEPTVPGPEANGHTLSTFNPVPELLNSELEVPQDKLVELPEGASISESAQEPTSVDNSDSRVEEVTAPVETLNTSTDSENAKKRRSFFERTLWTFVMIGGFLLCLALGHAYMIMLVMVVQTLVYREVTALFSIGAPKKDDDDEPNGKDPWSKTLNWYFFVVTNFFLYGESIIYYFKHVVFSDWHFSVFAANHRFTSFSLYTIGFVGFVYSLQRQHLKSQFGLFCWVHMSLLVIVVSSHFIINNILEGLIWFWIPASLVICNDIWAYIFGITMGRTPLIKLSPKKTVEGFVGAFFSTIVFGQIWGILFMRSNYMICPAHDLGMNAFTHIECTPNPVFVWRAWEIPVALRVLLATIPLPGLNDLRSIPYAPYQFHLLVMSCFASLVAPFGGFFASGFKRAFNIKDFGHSIPGHGGMTDRMDCQFLMGVFTYVYYTSLVKEHHVTVGHVLQLIASGLTLEEQMELMGEFKRYLDGRLASIQA